MVFLQFIVLPAWRGVLSRACCVVFFEERQLLSDMMINTLLLKTHVETLSLISWWSFWE